MHCFDWRLSDRRKPPRERLRFSECRGNCPVSARVEKPPRAKQLRPTFKPSEGSRLRDWEAARLVLQIDENRFGRRIAYWNELRCERRPACNGGAGALTLLPPRFDERRCVTRTLTTRFANAQCSSKRIPHSLLIGCGPTEPQFFVALQEFALREQLIRRRSK